MTDHISVFKMLLCCADLMQRQLQVVFEHDLLLLKLELCCVYNGREFLKGITFRKKNQAFYYSKLCKNLMQKRKKTSLLGAQSQVGDQPFRTHSRTLHPAHGGAALLA